MKRIFYYLTWALALVISYYLYQRQLGAIPFFLLSIYFFWRAKKELSNQTEQMAVKLKRTARKKIRWTRHEN